MIEELCVEINNTPQFIDDYDLLIRYGLALSIVGESEYSAEMSERALKRILQTATVFSMSNNDEYKRKAYEIVINAWKLIKEDSNRFYQTDKISAIIDLVLTRLGNFPAERKFKIDNQILEEINIPSMLWFEEEFHRQQNSVPINQDIEIILTDFQKGFWNSMEKYPVVVVTAPTSAGKSFALQNYLASLFFSGRIEKAVYLVPTRALISQIMKDLQKIFLNDSSIRLTEIPTKESGKILYVLTQERMQMLLEQEQHFDFVVIDEAQNISDTSRGIILQSVVERVMIANPQINMLFGSPFTKNPAIFQKTFGIKDEFVDIVNTKLSPVTQNLLHVQTDKYKNNQLVISKIDEENVKEERHIATLYTNSEFVDKKKYLAQIALALGEKDNNIVFGSEPSACENIAYMITSTLEEIDDNGADEDLHDFSQYLKSHIREDYLLARCIEKGVAFHYGNCVFRRHPDSDFGNIRTAYRNYPDSVSETSGHLAWLTN